MKRHLFRIDMSRNNRSKPGEVLFHTEADKSRTDAIRGTLKELVKQPDTSKVYQITITHLGTEEYDG